MTTRPAESARVLTGGLGRVRRAPRTAIGRIALCAALLTAAFAAVSASALANAPNPTSIVVNSVVRSGSNLTVTVSGTWTWDKRVPNGPQVDCNDSRIGVGVAVGWGDNTLHPLKPHNTSEIIYVGDAGDNWVHSVTVGTQTVDGPFKPTPTKITESMLGETPDAVLNGFGPQGISTGASAALPTKTDAEHWFSNCGPTAQSVVNGQTIGNSNPSEPTKGFPNGTWGPISHTYTTTGPHKICPVMYDPHGNRVGGFAPNQKEITAGGTGHNGDNSVESNNNVNPCVVSVTPKEPAFETIKEQRFQGETNYTRAKLIGKIGQKVEYKITVKDTGETSLSLGALNDAKCDAGTISAPSKSPINPGESAFYTCSHVLNATGIFVNTAIVTATPPEEPPIMHETPPVEVEVPPEPAFTIKKEQRFEGEASYRTTKLIGKVGQRVEYKITVTDTGTTSLTLGPLSDPSPKCESGTLVGPSENPINPRESAIFTCSRVLPFAGVFFNAATETAEGGGKTITHTSNEVEVEAKVGKARVFVGYVNEAANNHGSSSAHPNPWKGSANVTFIGCGFGGTNTCPKEGGFDLYDAGAIRVDATTESGALNVTGARVVIGPCVYEPWPGLNATIQPGSTLILTQTGKLQCTTGSSEQDNFDTSESFLKSTQYQEFVKGGSKLGTCKNDGFIPAVTLTINGETFTLNDSAQTLNTGGIDPDICTGLTEVREWRQIQ
jgi:hypothetical protein